MMDWSALLVRAIRSWASPQLIDKLCPGPQPCPEPEVIIVKVQPPPQITVTITRTVQRVVERPLTIADSFSGPSMLPLTVALVVVAVFLTSIFLLTCFFGIYIRRSRFDQNKKEQSLHDAELSDCNKDKKRLTDQLTHLQTSTNTEVSRLEAEREQIANDANAHLISLQKETESLENKQVQSKKEIKQWKKRFESTQNELAARAQRIIALEADNAAIEEKFSKKAELLARDVREQQERVDGIEARRKLAINNAQRDDNKEASMLRNRLTDCDAQVITQAKEIKDKDEQITAMKKTSDSTDITHQNQISLLRKALDDEKKLREVDKKQVAIFQKKGDAEKQQRMLDQARVVELEKNLVSEKKRRNDADNGRKNALEIVNKHSQEILDMKARSSTSDVARKQEIEARDQKIKSLFSEKKKLDSLHKQQGQFLEVNIKEVDELRINLLNTQNSHLEATRATKVSEEKVDDLTKQLAETEAQLSARTKDLKSKDIEIASLTANSTASLNELRKQIESLEAKYQKEKKSREVADNLRHQSSADADACKKRASASEADLATGKVEAAALKETTKVKDQMIADLKNKNKSLLDQIQQRGHNSKNATEKVKQLEGQLQTMKLSYLGQLNGVSQDYEKRKLELNVEVRSYKDKYDAEVEKVKLAHDQASALRIQVAETQSEVNNLKKHPEKEKQSIGAKQSESDRCSRQAAEFCGINASHIEMVPHSKTKDMDAKALQLRQRLRIKDFQKGAKPYKARDGTQGRRHSVAIGETRIEIARELAKSARIILKKEEKQQLATEDEINCTDTFQLSPGRQVAITALRTGVTIYATNALRVCTKDRSSMTSKLDLAFASSLTTPSKYPAPLNEREKLRRFWWAKTQFEIVTLLAHKFRDQNKQIVEEWQGILQSRINQYNAAIQRILDRLNTYRRTLVQDNLDIFIQPVSQHLRERLDPQYSFAQHLRYAFWQLSQGDWEHYGPILDGMINELGHINGRIHQVNDQGFDVLHLIMFGNNGLKALIEEEGKR